MADKAPDRKIKATATILLTEYDDGTVDCIPKFTPDFNPTLGCHAMISAMYKDMNTFLTNTKPGDKDEKDSNKPTPSTH